MYIPHTYTILNGDQTAVNIKKVQQYEHVSIHSNFYISYFFMVCLFCSRDVKIAATCSTRQVAGLSKIHLSFIRTSDI